MSQENVGVVRAIYAAFAQHRFPDDWLADDFVWQTNPALPDATAYTGHEAVRAYFRGWVGGWYDVQSDVEQLIDRGCEVVALIHGRYRLSPEGEPMEARYAHVWTVRDGKAVQARATNGRTPEELGFQLDTP